MKNTSNINLKFKIYTATPKTPWLATGMKVSVMLSAEPTLLGSPLAQIPRGLPRGRVHNLKLERRAMPGATLVMSILILSLLVGAGIGFSVLIFGQIQAARSFDNAVVAEITAQSRVEEVMYYLRKENKAVILNSDCPPDYNNEPPYSNGALTNCTLNGENSVTVNLAENDSAQFDLFANNQLGTPDIQGIKIRFPIQNDAPTPTMEVTIWSLRNDGANFAIETGQGLYTDASGRRLITGGDKDTDINFRFNDTGFACENMANNFCVYKTLDGANKNATNNFIQTDIKGYRVKIKSLYNSFNNVTVTPLDVNGAVSGLVFPSPLKIRVTGNFRGSKFTEEVTATTRPSLSGLFDYALFSPSDIIKQ